MAFGISASAAALGGAIVGSALIGSNAAKSAAGAQANAANAANKTQWDMYNQTRTDQAPWRAAGETALGQLGAGTADGGQFMQSFNPDMMQADPGYQFRMDQGQQALERSAAARGGALGGGSLKALTRYGQDYASGEYQNAYSRFNNDQSNRFNRLASIAGLGQTANGQVQSAGMNAANNVASNQLAAGNAMASGYVGNANAINSGIGNLQSMYYMNKMFPNGGAVGSAASTPAQLSGWGSTSIAD